MNKVSIKSTDQNIFKTWSEKMAYLLGYIFADGCILFDKSRKENPYTLIPSPIKPFKYDSPHRHREEVPRRGDPRASWIASCLAMTRKQEEVNWGWYKYNLSR